MTSKLKCPFCGAELGKEQGSERWWYCVNAKCVHKYTTTHETIWQALIQAKQDLEIATKALGYCIKMFKSLENVLDEKVEASDMPDNPDLYAWVVRIKPIWSELKEITGTDYKTEHK